MKIGEKRYRTIVRNRSYSLSDLYPVVSYFPTGSWRSQSSRCGFLPSGFEAIKAKGIRLLVNLYHFDLPFALQEDGDGWENKATIKAYEDYARFCFENYGDLVDQWITFNEPIVPVEFGYFYDAHYPHKVDAKAAVKVAYHTQLASTLAVKACHEVLPGSKIGIVLNLTPAIHVVNILPDVKAARIADPLPGTIFPRSVCFGNLSRRIGGNFG